MTLRLLTNSLVAATLLCSTISCAKKEDTPTPVRGTGSYKVSGRPVSGISMAHVSTDATQKTDRLSIVLSDTPVSQSNTQTVLLVFEKPTTQPNTAYQLTELSYTPDNTNNFNKVNYTANVVTTLQETSPGVFSGTFSGTSTSSVATPTLSEGLFTDARL
jgi:hypothetical protein